MMMLFIVLFQKQTPYTFGKGTYFMPRDVTKIPTKCRRGHCP